ncbi:MAG: hypothetical protein LBR60_08175, partial [Fibrobacter sp.]|nr:hypothetical protein [Fibrobacter sp.]
MRFLIRCLIFLSFSFAFSSAETKPHFYFEDSSKTTFAFIRVSASDSLTATRFKDQDKEIDNSLIFRIFASGEITPAFYFRATGNVFMDNSTRSYLPHNYEPFLGLPYNAYSDDEHKRTWDTFTAYSEYRFLFGKLTAGVDYLTDGVAKRNKVILRGDHFVYRPWMEQDNYLKLPAPIPFVGFELQAGPFTYTQYSGKLYHKKNKDKYIHHHRLGIELPFSVEFGVSENIIYGSTVEPAGSNPNQDGDSVGRSLELIYTLPFVPYVFAEHFAGDRDNKALAFDLSIRTIPGWEFYGELFWDDMNSPLSMFDDSWWGNKWAASVGMERKNLNLGVFLLSWIFEYTRIEPWVYTHHLGASHRYTHYGQSLGSDLGPNAQEIYTKADIEFKKVILSLSLSSVAKDTAFGGNIADIHTPESATDKKFLNDATTIRYRELSAMLCFTPWEWLQIRAGGSLFLGDYEGYRTESALSLTW